MIFGFYTKLFLISYIHGSGRIFMTIFSGAYLTKDFKVLCSSQRKGFSCSAAYKLPIALAV